METHKDPVCGMQVEEGRAAGSTERGGRTYYFCSASCKAKFDEDPGRYVGERVEAGGG